MSYIFRSPKTPDSPPPPPPPELDPTVQVKADEEARKQRRGVFGRASTILTGGMGDLSTPTLASKTLLGQ